MHTNKQIQKCIRKDIKESVITETIDLNRVKISVEQKKACVYIIYSVKNKELILESDILKIQKVVKKCLKNNSFIVYALSRKKKEAKKGVKFPKKLKKVRFTTVRSALLCDIHTI